MSASSSHLHLPASLLFPFSWFLYLYEENDGRGRNLASLVMIILFWIVVERASGFISVSTEMKGNFSQFNGFFKRLLALEFCRDWSAFFSEQTLWRISRNSYRYLYIHSPQRKILMLDVKTKITCTQLNLTMSFKCIQSLTSKREYFSIYSV